MWTGGRSEELVLEEVGQNRLYLFYSDAGLYPWRSDINMATEEGDTGTARRMERHTDGCRRP